MRVAVSSMDVRLGLRMLRKYPGLTIAGGLALALAIGLGAAWFDVTGDLLRPRLPLPDGGRIVEVEMRDAAGGGDERRILHDFTAWRREVRLLENLGAYRTLERDLILGDARPVAVTVAETTASAFRVAGVRPALGRPLLDEDERPGASPVVVIGHNVWQRYFDGRDDVVGRAVQLGRTRPTVVGVMPEGFAFPVNHRIWVPLQLQHGGYAPLEGAPIRVFANVAPGATQEQAYAELMTIAERQAAASPATHTHLRPRVLAYGGESPGDRSLLERLVTHLPVVLVLLIACANVGTLVYARTAIRESEIAMRSALGATRGRIVGQLFVEALVLAGVAAAVGLVAADRLLKWGMNAYYSGVPGGTPFWVDPGLKPRTIAYALALTVAGAALLGIFPALRATGGRVQAQIRNLGGGSTLRFGAVWTTVMIAQVALTVICIPPAIGISHEALRDRRIRAAYPGEEYLAVRVDLDRDTIATAGRDETEAEFDARFARLYAELERRIRQQPDVKAVTYGDRLPGMAVDARRAEFEAAAGAPPSAIDSLWTAVVGSGYFAAFDRAIVAGRDLREDDRARGNVLVNEAFARQFTNGASPIGRRLRFAVRSNTVAQPWMEIVGVVRDVGMTPTDRGEAPYVFRAGTPATTRPLIMAVRAAGDAAAVAPRLRAAASGLDPGLRLDEPSSLDDLIWRTDIPMMIASGAVAGIVGLGLFLSAAGIFALTSVSVARRTREIGLRAALGASSMRLLGNVFARAAVLVGSGIAAGNSVLLLFVALQPELDLVEVLDALLLTSGVMFAVGLLACVEPARRALRIDPIEALKEA